MDIWPGAAYPLGATYDGTGTNFALFSEVAERVELCLFDDQGAETRIDLAAVDGFVWHGYVPNVGPGQGYGYRVHGPYDPERGLRCNPAKLLLDPYAKAIEGQVDGDESLYSYHVDDDAEPGGGPLNEDDSAPYAMRSIVVSPFFDWAGDQPPRRPRRETVIYEAHVKGLTMTHPRVPEELRGSYAGLAHPEIVEHLLGLGVTAVQLMPVHQFAENRELIDRGLSNYWGYDTVGFFAPHNAYSASGQRGQQVQEFKAMVRSLHAAGLEVILDVVYHHSAEGNHLGPTLAFRGIDNAAYYKLVENDPRYYYDTTGAGNGLNTRHPRVLQLIMDSLRYWVEEMHVDGFRFDLASALARPIHDVDRLSAFFSLIHQDPVVSRVKLIAEPWDIGDGGYQVGNFPPLWTEWNARYRDTVRDLWRGAPVSLGEFAARLTGSGDLYGRPGRVSTGSVNVVTAHDGFTLADLVSYDDEHNEANGGIDLDSAGRNRSWNCGVEGPTDDPAIVALRARQQRNFLTTLMLSQGVPMIGHGDELARTQQGNNHAYCQDNEVSWVDWAGAGWDVAGKTSDLTAFVRQLTAFRRAHPGLADRFVDAFHQTGHPLVRPDAALFGPDGERLTDPARPRPDCLALYLNGNPRADTAAPDVKDDSILAVFNLAATPADFTLPASGFAPSWTLELSTAPDVTPPRPPLGPGERVTLEARSLSVLVGRERA